MSSNGINSNNCNQQRPLIPFYTETYFDNKCKDYKFYNRALPIIPKQPDGIEKYRIDEENKRIEKYAKYKEILKEADKNGIPESLIKEYYYCLFNDNADIKIEKNRFAITTIDGTREVTECSNGEKQRTIHYGKDGEKIMELVFYNKPVTLYDEYNQPVKSYGLTYEVEFNNNNEVKGFGIYGGYNPEGEIMPVANWPINNGMLEPLHGYPSLESVGIKEKLANPKKNNQ